MLLSLGAFLPCLSQVSFVFSVPADPQKLVSPSFCLPAPLHTTWQVVFPDLPHLMHFDYLGSVFLYASREKILLILHFMLYSPKSTFLLGSRYRLTFKVLVWLLVFCTLAIQTSILSLVSYICFYTEGVMCLLCLRRVIAKKLHCLASLYFCFLAAGSLFSSPSTSGCLC